MEERPVVQQAQDEGVGAVILEAQRIAEYIADTTAGASKRQFGPSRVG